MFSCMHCILLKTLSNCAGNLYSAAKPQNYKDGVNYYWGEGGVFNCYRVLKKFYKVLFPVCHLSGSRTQSSVPKDGDLDPSIGVFGMCVRDNHALFK